MAAKSLSTYNYDNPILNLIIYIFWTLCMLLIFGTLAILGWLACNIVATILPGFRRLPFNWKALLITPFLGAGILACFTDPPVAIIMAPITLFVLWLTGNHWNPAPRKVRIAKVSAPVANETPRAETLHDMFDDEMVKSLNRLGIYTVEDGIAAFCD